MNLFKQKINKKTRKKYFSSSDPFKETPKRRGTLHASRPCKNQPSVLNLTPLNEENINS